ncbi:MAG: heavy metal translocating P-type ATPase [Ndongobacter sp.]|nr:heavy metal translocating P-type ATPase [Ndongobacter sp.]
MKPVLVSDLPGRLRVRYGIRAFCAGQGYAFEKQLLRYDFIVSCETNPVNGSLLVLYDPAFRENVLTLLRGVRFSELKDELPPEGDRREATRLFQKAVIKRFVMKQLTKRLFPMPLYRLWVWYRAIPFLRDGAAQLLQKKLNVPVLDATSVGVSMASGELSTAANIMFFLDLSQLLEQYTTQRVQMDLIRSLSLKVDTVWRVSADGSADERVPFSDVQLGDRLRVRSGSVIPVDGLIVSGEGMIDESSMTGESRAIEKRENTMCYAGTVVVDGNLVIEVRAVGDRTKRHRIIEEIDEAGAGRAERATQAQRVAQKLVPYHFLASGLIYLLTRNVQKAMATLLVDYSCAIKLCTPIATLAAIREAADHEIAVKGGKHLEHLANASIFLFDKTGTLTRSQPRLVQTISLNGDDADELLRIAACIEEHFPHSVARAIVNAAKEKGLQHEELHDDVEYVVAHGIRSAIQGQSICIGSRHFLFDDEKVVFSEEQKATLSPYEGTYSILYLGIGGRLAAAFLIDDPARPEAFEALQALRDRGVRELWMVTGDGPAMAQRIAEDLKMDRVFSQVLPDEKSALVERVRQEYGAVAMVGDGINDSPALARAEVSIAMKDASDIAREVADIVLLNSDLRKLAQLRLLADAMNARIHRNLTAILAINTTLLGAGVIGVLAPTQTAFLHNASTFALATEAARPYRVLSE